MAVPRLDPHGREPGCATRCGCGAMAAWLWHRTRAGGSVTKKRRRPRRRAPQPRRATSTERGYGARHRALRAEVGKDVAAGRATCARCGRPIHPAADWHLDHHDEDRTRYIGPSHASCNVAAAQRRRWRREAMERRTNGGLPAQMPRPRPRALSFFDPPSKHYGD